MEQEYVYLYPSNLIVSANTTLIRTVLGSCVAVCIWDKFKRTGGMNHYMLPFWNGNGLASPKYGNIAIKSLVDKMIENGSSRQNLVAKVFGGGEIIEVQQANYQIGERNILIAENLLSEYKIQIRAKSVGGKFGRKIQFNTNSGEVLMSYVKRSGSV